MWVTPKQLEKVLKSDLKFSQVAFSMLVTRLKSVYAKDGSPKTLKNGADEINAFLKKYEALMGTDYAAIAKM